MTAIQKRSVLPPLTLVLCALLSASGGCDRGSKLEPSLNTVDEATHSPYQLAQPKTTGNPMSDTDAYPDRPGDDAHPSHHAPPEEPELAGPENAAVMDEAPEAEINPHTGTPSKDLASPAPTVPRQPAPPPHAAR